MGILDQLLSNGDLQRQFTDFVNRYEQGHPADGYSDGEVVQRYGEVSHAVPQDQYAQAAQEALSRLSPEERAAFVKMLQQRAQATGQSLPQQVSPDPGSLSQVLTNLHQTPGMLRDILGGGGGGSATTQAGSATGGSLLASPLARAALAGITAMVVKRVMQGPQR
jgi:hypothetical protein